MKRNHKTDDIPAYYAKSADGIVHVMNPDGCGEYTYCGVEIMDGSGDPFFHEGGLDACDGPCNCKECMESVETQRSYLRRGNIRFARRLRSCLEEK